MVPLPTIQEKLPVDETCNVLSESSDSNHNSHISVEKGKHCQGPGSVEDLQEAREYVKDPREERRAWLRKARAT
ncbi:hypothetical protein Hamer_G005403 [Homarus americanus]|uniref:Uncharacterized protein n=1 Tax=Homarus americanus TaxID=6706 RepID=A0A8J5K3W4_HOMAM|nr:hypothetical protein Hamer_G005403 [Homarus americanus]